VQWVNNNYPSLITDSAPLEVVGGSSKIDSLQNVLLLRSDLHNAWDNYCIAVNPSVCVFLLLASMLPVLGLNSYSEDTLSSPSFLATTTSLERSSILAISWILIRVLLTNFSAIIFFKLC
jgi:HNH endonuclease